MIPNFNMIDVTQVYFIRLTNLCVNFFDKQYFLSILTFFKKKLLHTYVLYLNIYLLQYSYLWVFSLLLTDIIINYNSSVRSWLFIYFSHVCACILFFSLVWKNIRVKEEKRINIWSSMSTQEEGFSFSGN